MRKTKIIATIGPATESKVNLEKIIKAGVNVCRLNFSHGSHEDHLKVIKNIAEINKEQ
jgi:pyruvate kinase